MSILSNRATESLVLEMERGKPFKFCVRFVDQYEDPIVVPYSHLKMSVPNRTVWNIGKWNGKSLFEKEIRAEYVDAHKGFVFLLEATDLEVEPGEYPLSITVINDANVSAVLLKGVLRVVENYDSVTPHGEFTMPEIPVLAVKRGDSASIVFKLDASRHPDYVPLTKAEKEKYDLLEPLPAIDWNAPVGNKGFIHNKPVLGTLAYMDEHELMKRIPVLPAGGRDGDVLVKSDNSPSGIAWAKPDIETLTMPALPDTLAGENIPPGMLPMWNGSEWVLLRELDFQKFIEQEVGSAVAVQIRSVEDALAVLKQTHIVDWSLKNPLLPGFIQNKPQLGSASSEDVSAFAPAQHSHTVTDVTGVFQASQLPKLSELRGVKFVTSLPQTASDGDVVFLLGD